MNTTAIDTNIYFAKAGLANNPWRTPHTTRENAIERAKWFVREWLNNGLETSARVFYRDGSLLMEVTAKDVVANA